MSETPFEVAVVKAVVPHPNADRLEIVKVLGTQFVTVKGKFQAEDLCVYFPPDMLISEDVAESLGVANYLKHSVYPGDLQKSRCRIGAIRLRGTASFGFGITVEEAVQGANEVILFNLAEGDDLTSYFDGEKYQPDEKFHSGDSQRQPGAFHTYTSIQHYYRHEGAIPAGTPVRITEKIHGCLASKQSITMADTSKKKIPQVEVGDEVLGVENGKVCTSIVTEVFRNGKADKWLRIQTTRKKVNRGPSFGVVRCTPEHRFWSPELNCYRAAGELKKGDKVSMFRSKLSLHPAAYQILLGKMLGDGSLQVRGDSAMISWGHISKELVDWTGRGVGELFKTQKPQISGYGSKIYRANTTQTHAIKEAFEDFIAPGAKKLPAWVVEKMTPLALAFWYMDDGSLSHHEGQEDRAMFNSCGFSEAEHDTLLEVLAKFDIQGVKYQSEGFWRIRLNADDAEKLFLLVAPYIPESLQYKLPERYRGHQAWLPAVDAQYKPDLVEQTITYIDDVTDKIQSHRYDIETTTHNYFAGDILVHNSNSRVGLVMDDGFEFMCGTRRQRKKYGDKKGRYSLYWNPLTDDMKEMLEFISRGEDDVIVFGEIYGNKIQQMDYACDRGKGYRAFDISVNGDYLDWVDVHLYCRMFGILTVSVLYEGVFFPGLVDKYVSGPTSIAPPDDIRCAFRGREGIVITPLEEQFSDSIGGRLILKAVSSDYYEAMK